MRVFYKQDLATVWLQIKQDDLSLYSDKAEQHITVLL